MSNELVRHSVPELERMAAAIAKSGMFSVKTPDAALSLMLIAQSEGVHPAQAMMDYDVIEGKPALKSAAMLARFQGSGGKVKWLEANDEKVSGEFTHPQGGTITVTWDTARITKAGLAGRQNHQKYPTQMKRARCISEAVRALFPASIPVGFYTTEEVHDMTEVTPVVATIEAPEPRKQLEVVPSGAAYDFIAILKDCQNPEDLKKEWSKAYQTLWDAEDMKGLKLLKAAHDDRKSELTKAA